MLPTHLTRRGGLALIDGGHVGVVTASNSASIKLWPEAELRAIAAAKGISLQSEQSPREQWPLLLYKSSNLQKAISELEGTEAARLAAGLAGLARADEGSGALFGGGGAASWLIDFNDLACSTVIGEGAFGKVFLGRWQETDVAIKMLGSLQALGLAAGSVQHDEGGGVKLGADVQRQLEREVGLMVAMRHPCIILFMGVCLEPACVVTGELRLKPPAAVSKQARKCPCTRLPHTSL